MKKKSFKSYISTLVAALSILMSFQSLAEDELISGRLNNGLTYFILKNSKPENRASLNLVVKSGSLAESQEQRGLAHFLEHMAFNGTRSYPKNDLVKYLQSIGLSFGGDLNAHTSYNETVYKLKVPSDSEASLEEGFKVLREWATEITLDSGSVDGEKNIILEEWRGRQGLAERLGKVRRKLIFGNSLYNERNPIGVPETIKGATPKLLSDYYETWYNPNLMAVIAVGDFDVKLVEKIIERDFDFKSRREFKSPESYPLPEVKSDIVIFSDPELTSSTIDILRSLPYTPSTDDKSILKNLEETIFGNIFNSRLSLLGKKSDTDFRSAVYYSYPMGDGTAIEGIQIAAKENRMGEALEEVLMNLKSLSEHPPKESELAREINAVSVYLKDRVTNRDAIENEKFIREIRDQFIDGEPFLSPKESYDTFERLKVKITPEAISKIAKRIYGESKGILIAYPEKKDSLKYERSEFENIIKKVDSSPIPDLSSESSLTFTPVPLKAGKIMSEKSLKDYTLFTLSNGMNVYYKETDFQKDRIYIDLFREQGSSSLNFKGHINSIVAPTLISKSGVGELDKDGYELFMKDKNFSITTFIDDYEQGFKIATDRENLSLALDTFTTIIEDKKLDEDLLEKILQNLRERIENMGNSPRAIYSEKLNQLISSNNPRRRAPTLEEIREINREEIGKVYSEMFSNFSGYNAIVVGSISKEEIREILIKYLSALPHDLKTSSWKPLNIAFPKGETRETLKKGEDEKAVVTIVYPYLGKFSNDNRVLYKAYSDLLNIILIDKIREEMSSVYSISSSGSLRYENHGEDRLVIRFSTNPENVEKVSKRVREIVEETVAGKGIDKALGDVKENYRLTYNTEILKNDFWSAYLKNHAYKNRDYKVLTPDEFNVLASEKNIRELMREGLNSRRFVETILVPEVQQSKK